MRTPDIRRLRLWRLDLWKMARFRLTLLYGAMFVSALVALLGLVYWQTAGYLGRQVDGILRVEARAFLRGDAESLPARIRQQIERDPRHIDLYGLFSREGIWITGNARTLPGSLAADGVPREVRRQAGFPPGARALLVRLPWGELLLVGRDVAQLAEIRRIILRALVWSGALVIAAGLGGAAALSIRPLRRIQKVREASERIMAGDLAERLPAGGSHDEIDMLAHIVNVMMDEIEVLIARAKSAGDHIAHDLRTPLTRLRLLLHRVREETALSADHRATLDQALDEADTLLGRFHALLRIAEIESQRRRAGFATVELGQVLEQAVELYGPLAEDGGLVLDLARGEAVTIEADRELLFEALGNLIDNAIKFTPPGGRVLITLTQTARGPRLDVVDDGPGLAAGDREAATGRFHRGEQSGRAPGFGLGLSIVEAVARLHGFALTLDDAAPGLRASMECWSSVTGS
jgi:signal transduction histidine kinase